MDSPRGAGEANMRECSADSRGGELLTEPVLVPADAKPENGGKEL